MSWVGGIGAVVREPLRQGDAVESRKRDNAAKSAGIFGKELDAHTVASTTPTKCAARGGSAAGESIGGRRRGGKGEGRSTSEENQDTSAPQVSPIHYLVD
jgi:hypothetical protein